MAVQRRNTRQRRLVLDAVRQSYNHPTADEIYNAVREQDDKISRGTVYRNLAMFLEEGQIISVGTVDGQERYDARTDFHAHLVCRRCRCVTDIEPTDEVKTICEALARSSGCKPDGISLSYTGLCRNCLAGE